MAPKPKKPTPAEKRAALISQITGNQRVAANKFAEAQSYAPLRELIVTAELGLGVPQNTVVVDSPVPFGRERPDVQVWLEGVPVELRNEANHLFAILELKSGTKVRDNGKAIARDELASYGYRHLRYFWLADSEVVMRYDLGGANALPAPIVRKWDELAGDAEFLDFFGPLTSDRRKLSNGLVAFAESEVPLGAGIVDAVGHKRFVNDVVTVARILSNAVSTLVTTVLTPDLERANKIVAAMSATYGEATYDFSKDDEFLAFADEPPPADHNAHALYNEKYTQLMADLEPVAYALRAEREGLASYATRSGLKPDDASFLSAHTTAKSARESFVQETSTLLFSRLLMIRFSEDHGLLKSYLSNGGLSTFARYATHFRYPFQKLVSDAYHNARPLYRHLFERKPLDWLIEQSDLGLSESLLHAMWILAGWDFRTVRGDILSGIYDRNLDARQRRTLGEVYTRPELARYMLTACGWTGTQKVLDPACGSGTFLVEAFEQTRTTRIAAGVGFDDDDAVAVISLLHGLDINSFSATLAKIQLLWHVLSAEAESAADTLRSAIGTLRVEGGSSSLDTWGVTMKDGPAVGLFGAEEGRGNVERQALSSVAPRRLKTAERRFRDISGARGGYEIVVGNPPYVRVHRIDLEQRVAVEYNQVKTKQADLSVLFVFRALKWWLAPGGKLGFFLPLAITETAYAENIRRVMDEYRIIEIIDLELIGNAAFHGTNIVTCGLIIEKTPSTPDDVVKITSVTAACLDEKTGLINMSLANTTTIKRDQIKLDRYLPCRPPAAVVDDASTDISDNAQADPQDGELIGAEEDDAAASDGAWLTKLRSSEVPVLEKLSQAPRLSSLVLRGWMKKGKGVARRAAAVPTMELSFGWVETLVMGYGLKVGGKAPKVAGGKPIYKGNRLHPDGIAAEEPLGTWNGDVGLVDTPRFYAWEGIGDTANDYAVRNIARLPIFAPMPADAYLSNTVYCVRLAVPFALNVWSLSRIVGWYMAKTSRTSVIQSFFATYVPRNTMRMPVPHEMSPDQNAKLSEIGDDIFRLDAEMAAQDQTLDRFRDFSSGMAKPLKHRLDLLNDDAVSKPDSVCWPDAGSDWSKVVASQNGDDVVFLDPTEDFPDNPASTPTGPCIIKVKNADLRRWVENEAAILLEAGGLPSKKWMSNLPIPNDVEAAMAAVDRLANGEAASDLASKMDELDAFAAEALGLSSDEASVIKDAMRTDEMLSTFAPHWRHSSRARRARYVAYGDRSRYV